MTRLQPQDLAQFARKYRFAGGRLSRVRVRTRGSVVSVVVSLLVRAAAKDLSGSAALVRLRLRLDGVDEFRFQKRLNSGFGRVTDVKFGYFSGAVFVNLDAWGLQPGEVPGVHDFRASDAYLAGRELSWEEVPPKPAG